MQHRNTGVHKGVFALGGQGGGFTGVIVAGDGQHPTMLGGAGGIGMLKHISGTIHPWALAVPHTKHPVVFGAGEDIGLLATPYGGGTQILVDPRDEVNMVVLQELTGLPQLLVKATQGRTPVAGDKAGGIQLSGGIPGPLHHGQSDQGLGAGQIDPAGL